MFCAICGAYAHLPREFGYSSYVRFAANPMRLPVRVNSVFAWRTKNRNNSFSFMISMCLAIGTQQHAPSPTNLAFSLTVLILSNTHHLLAHWHIPNSLAIPSIALEFFSLHRAFPSDRANVNICDCILVYFKK